MIANAVDVKACLERVLALMADRDKINEDIAQVLEDYKPKGVIGKGIRRVATLRRMDPGKRRNDEQLYSDYEDALGALPEAVELVRAGKTYDEAAEATGLSRATVARMVRAAREVSNGKDFETPHDPETGEINPGEGAADAAKPVTAQAAAPTEVETALDTPPSPEPEFEVGTGTHSEEGGVANSVRDGGAPVATSTVGPAVTTSFAMALGAESIARREAKHAEDDLAIPAYLRRVRA